MEVACICMHPIEAADCHQCSQLVTKNTVHHKACALSRKALWVRLTQRKHSRFPPNCPQFESWELAIRPIILSTSDAIHERLPVLVHEDSGSLLVFVRLAEDVRVLLRRPFPATSSRTIWLKWSTTDTTDKLFQA